MAPAAHPPKGGRQRPSLSPRMEISAPGVAAALPRMQKRRESGSRAGGRLALVRSGRLVHLDRGTRIQADCESGDRATERGAARQHADALPMRTPGHEGAWPRGCFSSRASVRRLKANTVVITPKAEVASTARWRLPTPIAQRRHCSRAMGGYQRSRASPGATRVRSTASMALKIVQSPGTPLSS
jgi:hypothetical protein